MVFMDNQAENKEAQKLSSRRKFLLGAAKAAPVVTSMTALPVWANGVSISGNLSGNVSGNYTESLFDGCSPGYYHKKNSNGNARNRLPKDEYLKDFATIFEGYGPLEKVYVVLDPSRWKDSSAAITQIDRKALTTYYNASSYSGAGNFPYTTAEVIYFYKQYALGKVGEAEASEVFNNLIHFGEGKAGVDEGPWTSGDESCGIGNMTYDNFDLDDEDGSCDNTDHVHYRNDGHDHDHGHGHGSGGRGRRW
jgi:hypothetical protein